MTYAASLGRIREGLDRPIPPGPRVSDVDCRACDGDWPESDPYIPRPRPGVVG